MVPNGPGAYLHATIQIPVRLRTDDRCSLSPVDLARSTLALLAEHMLSKVCFVNDDGEWVLHARAPAIQVQNLTYRRNCSTFVYHVS